MFRLLRTMISLSFLCVVLWFAFSVDLGRKTLAEHVDAIGQTDEAKDLLDGARETVNPAIERAKERIIGEYVEAPTYIEAASDKVTSKFTGKDGKRAKGEKLDSGPPAGEEKAHAVDPKNTAVPDSGISP